MFVVQYAYDEWKYTDWRFIGVFTEYDTARKWIESQFLTVEWRKPYGGDLNGDHATGVPVREQAPSRFVLMEVEPDDLIGKRF